MEEKIKIDMAEALKNGDKIRLSVLRMVISSIKNKKIEDMVKTLDEAKIIAIIQKMAREHIESIEQFKKGNREDLVKKETDELKILQEYLPEALSEGEIEKIVAEAMRDSSASSIKDMGKVMTIALGKIKGRADGKIVSEKVKQALMKKGGS